MLIQVYFHAQIAEERGDFDLDDVAHEVNEKLLRRHPHVFGEGDRLSTSDQVLTKWEEIKAQEKKNGPVATGSFKPQPPRLPATMLAEAVWKQILKKQLPRPPSVQSEAVEALSEELDDAVLGRELFVLCAAARSKGLDSEGALRRYADKVMHDVEQSLDES